MHIFTLEFFGIQIAPTWYGLMYALGFAIAYLFMKKYSKIKAIDLDTLLTYAFFGVVLGGRFGYVLLYNLGYFIDHPIDIFKIWQGGMSFHGGALGVIIALFLFAKRCGYPIFQISDPLVTILPIALGLGRIGNYINGELLGFFPYFGPLAILKNGISYFPSTLLEASLEGGLLTILMLTVFWNYKRSKKPYFGSGIASGIFLLGYGCCRIFSEFFRLPDAHIGYLWGTSWITLGMLYTLPIFIGAVLVYARISGRLFPGKKNQMRV